MTLGLLTSEVRKVTTLKFWWALLIAPLAVGLFASAIYAAVSNSVDEVDSSLSTGFASVGLYFALAWVILFAGIFGAINAGTEYRHKTLTPTFLSASGRDGVLAAKLIVTVGFALGYGIVVEVTSFAAMVIFGGGNLEITGELFGVFLVGLYAVACWSLIGAGLGMLFKSPVGAALALVAWYVAGEFTVALIATGFGSDAFGSWLPVFATIATVAAGQLDDAGSFRPFGVAFVVLTLWTMAFAGSGWLATRERDIT